MIIAKRVDFNSFEEEHLKNETSADGKGFTVEGIFSSCCKCY